MISKFHLRLVSLGAALFLFGLQSVATEAPGAIAPEELMFVDSAVDDWQILLTKVRPGIETVVLDSQRDALEQITTALRSHRNLTALHIVSHGAPGRLNLGDQQIDVQLLARRSGEFETWRAAFAPQAEILLYGCDIGKTAAGQKLRDSLAYLTGAAVAVSTNPTGSPHLGGDWILESRRGGALPAHPIAYHTPPAYPGVLPAQTSETANFFSVYVRPGGTSNVWTIDTGTTPSQSGTFTVTSFAMQNIPTFNWNVTRGYFEYSTNSGSSWTTYPITTSPASLNFVSTPGTLWRFVDSSSGDTTSTNSFGKAWQLSGVSGTTTTGGTIRPDNAPTGISSDRPTIFDNSSLGAVIATLQPEDTGYSLKGHWEYESQSVADLFTFESDTSVNNSATLKRGTGIMPAAGSTVTITARYYDWYQTDGSGDPISGQGVSETVSFTVVSETSNELSLGDDLAANTYTTDSQLNPDLATLSTGDAVVVWQSGGQGGKIDNFYHGIYGQKFSSTGSASGSEFVISNSASDSDEINPSIASLGSGRYVVAYGRWLTDNYDICYRLVEANGTVGSEMVANTTTSGDQYYPKVATLTDGSFVIIWQSPGSEVRLRQFNGTTGAALAAETLLSSNGSDANVIGLDNGNYAACWADNSTYYISTMVTGGSPVDTGLYWTGYRAPDIAALSNGYVVVSEDYDDPNTQSNIGAVRYNNSAVKQGSTIRVNANTSGDRYQPAVAALSGGGFIVTWTSDTDDYESGGIFGRRFDASGTAIDTTEFEINQHRSGNQDKSAVASLADDRFIVAWTDNPGSLYNAGDYTTNITARVLESVTPSNDAPVAGLGDALNFERTNSEGVQVADANAIDFGTGSFTVEAWIKRAGAGTGFYTVAAQQDSAGWYFRFNGNRLNFTTAFSSVSGNSVSAAADITDTEWHHVVGVHDAAAKTVAIFIDGALSNSLVYITAANIDNTRQLGIGFKPGWGEYFDGSIDDVRLWNTARTASQILEYMRTPLAGDETGLIGYWTFEEGSGTTAANRTATSGLDGTLQNPDSDEWITGNIPYAVTTPEDTSLSLRLGGSDLESQSSATAVITALPANGSLYQTNDGSTLGTQISATETALTDSGGNPRRLLYVPDANFSGADTFTYKVNDGSADSGNTMTVNLTVSGVNDTPTLTTVSPLTGATEDTPFTISYATLAAAANEADLDGDALSFRVEAISTGTLTKNSTAVTAGVTLLSTGESLVWTPAANASGTLNAFTVTAWDGTAASATPVQIQVSVTAVNDASSVTGLPASLTFTEDTAGNPDLSASAFADVDSGSITVTLTASSGTFGLAAPGGIVVTLGGNGTSTITIAGAPAEINAYLDTATNITYTPAAHANGTPAATLTISANDGDGSGNVALGTVNLNITAVNDIPTDLALSNTTVNQSGATNANVGTLTTTDADTGDSHTYTLVAGTGDTNNASFNISGTTLRANNAAVLAAGDYAVRIQTADGNGGTLAEAFTITVVDDVAPAAPSTPDLAAGSDNGTSDTDNITTGDQPVITGTAEAGATVTLYDTDGVTVIGTGTATGGTWSITTSALADGNHTLTARATDAANNTSVASAGLTITLDNTGPVITSATTVALTYGTASTYTLTASGDPASFTALLGLPAGLSLHPTTGALTGTPTAVDSDIYLVSVGDTAGNETGGTLTITVAPAPLIITGLSGVNKTYDATTTATLSGTPALSGVVGSDDVDLDGSSVTATFDNKNVGTGKPITIAGFTLTGTTAGNYSLTQPSATGDITAAPASVTGVTAENKTYDGNTTATLDVSEATLVGRLGSDELNLYPNAATGTFDNRNVGTGKPVTTADFALQGNDAGNYVLTQPTPTADITAAGLTVTGVTAANKTYDGNTTATLGTGSATLVGTVSGDTVSLDTTSAAGAFANASVATGKPVTVSGLALTGTHATNYTLTQPTATADITAANLTVTGVTAANKVYDATPTATVDGTGATLVGIIGSDTVTPDVTAIAGTFNNASAATGKIVTVSGITLTGTHAGNYTVTQPTTTADITAKALTVTGVTAADRAYDGTTDATLDTTTAALDGVIGSDDVSLDTSSAAGTFDDGDIGTDKLVSVSGLSLTGTLAGNYSLTQPTDLADITAKELTVTGLTAANKTYDTTTTASLTGTATLVGVVGSEDVTLTGTAAGDFADANIGTAKPVAITGLSLAGDDLGNYSLTAPSTTADITAATITISGLVAQDKVYDATTDVVIDNAAQALVGILGSDAIGLDASAATAAFDTKNIGTDKPVTLGGAVLTGASAGNYTLVFPSDLTADITPAPLTVAGATTVSKVYDSTTTAAANLGSASLVGVQGSDDVSLVTTSAAADFVTAAIGLNKPVAFSGLTLAGADAANYTLIHPAATADITPLGVTITGVTAANKVYDGTTTATLDTTGAALVGGIGGDDVAVVSTAATGTFATAQVGTGITVTTAAFALTGADAGNYTLTPPTTAADITPAAITLTGLVAQDKVYDATTAATLSFTALAHTGVVGSDAVSLDQGSVTATFADKAIGTDKPVTLSGAVLTGASAGNYTLTVPADLTASITAAPLTLPGLTITTKPYDGTTAASLVTTGATLTGIQGSDTVAPDYSGVTVAFDTATAGTGKAITLSGLALSGTDAGNYTLTAPVLTGTITQVTLIVSAEPVQRVYGDENPALVATYTGFVGGEDASVLTGAPVLTTDATRTSPIGDTYIITVTVGTLASPNYAFDPQDSTFDILPGFHFADVDRDHQLELSELLRVIELYNTRAGTRRTGAYRSNDQTTDRYEPGEGTRILPHTADSNGDGRISLIELTRIIELYNARTGSTRTGAYHYEPSTEDGFAPGALAP